MLNAYEGDDVLERMIERVVCWIIGSKNLTTMLKMNLQRQTPSRQGDEKESEKGCRQDPNSDRYWFGQCLRTHPPKKRRGRARRAILLSMGKNSWRFFNAI